MAGTWHGDNSQETNREKRVCSACREVFSHVGKASFEKAGGSSLWHKDVQNILDAAENCDFCRRITESPGFSVTWVMQNSLRISFSHNEDGSGTRLNVTGTTGKNIVNIANFGLYVRELPSEETSQTFEGREIVKDSNSAPCFQIASGWLRDCIQNHPDCRSTWQQSSETIDGSFNDSRSSFYPTRLIDVGPADGASMPYLLLMKNGEDKPKGPITWIALSYRWGSESPMTTTIKNLQQMRQGIPLTSLPNTFRDAVTITQKLGQRYLWIDSLCIIQDSKEDWTREGSLMGDVYGHSFLTIAAHNSPDCHSGILTKRRDDEISVYPVANSVYGFPGVLKLWSRAKIILRHELLPWRLSVDGSESSLSTRGWVLQESVLSPRTLLYCKDQMFWECRTMILAEGSRSPLQVMELALGDRLTPDLAKLDLLANTQSGDAGRESGLSRLFRWGSKRPDRENHIEVSKSIPWISKKSFMSIHDISSLEICRAWKVLVEDYSSRRLTQPNDRPQAIAGLAAHFENRLGCPYVAGVFQYQPHSTLLWRVSRRRSPDYYQGTPEHLLPDYPSHTRAYHRAPTWSWLSIEGSVCFDTVDLSLQDPRYKPYAAEILLPTISKDGTNCLGSPRPGLLAIKGLWRHSSEYQIAELCQEILILRDPDRFRGRVVVCIFDFLDQQDTPSRARHRSFGILVIMSSGDHENFGDEKLYGLLLEPTAASTSSGTHRRIGLAIVEPYFTGANEKTGGRGGHDRSQWVETTTLIS